jgi:hypothetical protein
MGEGISKNIDIQYFKIRHPKEMWEIVFQRRGWGRQKPGGMTIKLSIYQFDVRLPRDHFCLFGGLGEPTGAI